jgi:GNAT superfamily N-acetyltransferase
MRELLADRDIAAAFPLMRQLRDRLLEETFLAEVRRQQAEGYRLFGLFELDRLCALAGVRRTHTLSRGKHLFVDDLVTAEDPRGQGHGGSLLRWLAGCAREQGIPRVYLDSRLTARGFYAKLGFQFLTSIPCWSDAGDLERG